MKYATISLFFLLSLLAVSCSVEVSDDIPRNPDGTYSYAMRFDGGVCGYDDSASRAGSKTWEKTSTVFLFAGDSRIGVATYDGSTWSLAADHPLTGNGTCKAVYIGGVTSASSSPVPLDAMTAVYEGSGTWSVSGSTLTLKAELAPSLGRLRFRGNSGSSVSIDGLTTRTSFNTSTGAFTTSAASVATSILSGGYTPYIYGTLTTSNLSVNGYTMTCPSGMMAPATSGWIDCPTASSHSGWVSNSGDDDAHEAVDLGLSVKWATCNVGASKPEEYGDYYAWGETTGYNDGKTIFSWAAYKYMQEGYSDWKHVTKYTTNDGLKSGCWYDGNTYVGTTVDGVTYKNKTTLDPEDDVAHVRWGGSWRMPTKAEQDELRTKCTGTWTTQNGVNGRKVTGPNGNSIFLPAAGCRVDSSLSYAGSRGYYWSSSLDSGDSDYAYGFYFNWGIVDWGSGYRNFGRSVRPVCP